MSVHKSLDRFKGVFIALNACYNEQGEVCPDTVKKLARHYAEIGVKGLYVGGSTGEGLLQSTEERKIVAAAVMEEVGSELCIIVHVGANSTRESCELAIHAEQIGAAAISAVPSIYYRVSEKAVEQHWLTIMGSTSLPFIIYHIPQTTGFQLSTKLLSSLAAHDQVIGVKISSESTFELQQFKAAGGEDFLVYNGPDEQFLAGLSMGADGGIGGTYGVMPELFMAIERCYRQGRMEEAKQWQYRVNEVITELLSYSSLYGACKAILTLRGFPCGSPRMPLQSLTLLELDNIQALNDKIEKYIAESQHV